ncbi:ubiquitin-like domain-containing CTD phosphatase 1 [Paragonimus westermani]|uniref:Ubiquitin-like domain-containing CTD phosphatase 1 n=1 Tax=Paragonimus westermani TaxID=34504 RepID=A0A5J4NML2_9TREM|nr:ubiquitin-like domain-containing CTD phosphatase 1 [Paragonimus westermani]
MARVRSNGVQTSMVTRPRASAEMRLISPVGLDSLAGQTKSTTSDPPSLRSVCQRKSAYAAIDSCLDAAKDTFQGAPRRLSEADQTNVLVLVDDFNAQFGLLSPREEAARTGRLTLWSRERAEGCSNPTPVTWERISFRTRETQIGMDCNMQASRLYSGCPCLRGPTFGQHGRTRGQRSSEHPKWSPSGMRQGCPASPFLFNFAVDEILDCALVDCDFDGVDFLPNTRLQIKETTYHLPHTQALLRCIDIYHLFLFKISNGSPMPDEIAPLVFNVKFNGKLVTVDCLRPTDTIADLKRTLFDKTQVLPETQKILGLRTRNNEPANDDLKLSQLVLKPNSKLMLIGSTQKAIVCVNKTMDIPTEVVDDFDLKEEDVQLGLLPENLEKVRRRAKAYRARRLCEQRPGKRLLVLDVDYTIFGHLTPAESARQLARPYLFEFLKRAYVHFDIVIWSATRVIPSNAASMLRAQAGEEAIVEDPYTADTSEETVPEPPFRITLLLDSSDMISVHFPSHGVREVKPLGVIWENHPQWGPHNTIMFDDVRRNFIMNPQSGLRIRSYRDAHVNYKTDHELRDLALYLELIAAREPDFKRLNHNHWERYVSRHKRQRINRGPSSKATSSRTDSTATVTEMLPDGIVAANPVSGDETNEDLETQMAADCGNPADGRSETDLP